MTVDTHHVAALEEGSDVLDRARLRGPRSGPTARDVPVGAFRMFRDEDPRDLVRERILERVRVELGLD